MSTKTRFFPVISSIQKIRIYETKTIIYLIGSNNRESRFRVLQINRNASELEMYEDPNEYGSKEIRKLISQLKFTRSMSAYGIIGFVRFVEGYHLILVTKRHKIGFIGNHTIYTIKDTTIYRICPEGVNKSSTNPLETRYLKMFMNVDLSSNFYFSYSYDLTRTLQYNMATPKFVGENAKIDDEEPLNLSDESEDRSYAFRSISRKCYVWNEFLLKPMQKKIVHKDWMLELIHGFVNQSSISIFGLQISVCLIARRSKNYAGTRFLKRGANASGDVANAVETEQIVCDGSQLSSFVQFRGSIPAHWSQDISKMVPKPTISLDIPDPFAETAGKHFEKLLFHHGSPIIILNLVKKREKRKHESILTDEITTNVKYLNQFLPAHYKLRYHHFDMARKNRTDKNVMESLNLIAESFIPITGFFYQNSKETLLQTGIIRTNCVDCLDRTNTAQFAMGRCALAHQLHKMGFLKTPPRLEFDSDCVAMLESLYEIHGDTLALQYGGSQLVHRIKTYRKTAPWTSSGSDIVQNLSRYYSNTFSDQEKQQSINLFLGYFIPYEVHENGEKLWDITNDYQLHNKPEEFWSDKAISSWFSNIIWKNLPISTSLATKVVKELIRIHTHDLEMIDLYSNYHLTYQFTSLEENIAFQLSQFARNFMPTFRTNFSPFEPFKRKTTAAINMTSSSNSSNSSSDEFDSSSDEDESNLNSSMRQLAVSDTRHGLNSFELECKMQKSCKEVYGFELESPNNDAMAKYKNYVKFQRNSQPSERKLKPIVLESLTNYTDSYLQVAEPKVKNETIEKYKNYCNLIINQEYDVNRSSLDILEKYANFVK